MAKLSEALIDLDALGRNFDIATERAGGRDVIAVVKADAYGHGVLPVVRCLRRRGCARFAVFSVDEMVTLRDAGVDTPVLVLAGAQDAADAEEIVRRSATPVIHNEGQVEWLEKAAQAASRPLSVQVEVDTGMRRMGVAAPDAPALLQAVQRRGVLALDGAFTHLARADESDLTPSFLQLRAFETVLGGHPAPIPNIHVANSAALLAADDLPLLGTAVRPGLMLYGARPADHLGAELVPVMTLRTRVVALRHLSRGECVGYGGTWSAPGPGMLATLAFGYADGLPRSVANAGEVEIDGRRAPIVGRVSMDSVGAWLGERGAALGAEVCVFGSHSLRVEEVSERAGTLAYELLVRVGSRVARRYVGGE